MRPAAITITIVPVRSSSATVLASRPSPPPPHNTPNNPRYGHAECIEVLFDHVDPQHVLTHKGCGETLRLTAAKGFVECVSALRVNVQFTRTELAEAKATTRAWHSRWVGCQPGRKI